MCTRDPIVRAASSVQACACYVVTPPQMREGVLHADDRILRGSMPSFTGRKIEETRRVFFETDSECT